jgi:hypothetical protein
MILDKQEYFEYIEVHLRLLYFVGKSQNIISSDTDISQFMNLDQQIKMKCRDKLNENIALIDEYFKASFDTLTTDQIKILEGFKKKKESDFIIFKCFAKHAILIDTTDNKMYAVKALSDGFDSFFSEFPVVCHMTILPFKDKIIYDGFLNSKEFYFGKNPTMEMSMMYKQAKIDKTIITMLT